MNPSSPPTSGRLLSLDVFRGATIVGMIVVNNPGTWAHVWGPLLHAEWHGWTPTDLIFPFFLFIAGVAIPLALGSRLEAGLSRAAILRKVAWRSAILFGLGLVLAAYPFVHFPLISDQPGLGLRSGAWDQLRIPAVLQRIALCYAAAALAYLYLPRRRLPWLVATLLVSYWLVMILVPVPGHGPGNLDDPEANLAAWVDRAVLGEDHLWAGVDRRWDPEGLLSTVPAVATALLGVLAGMLIRRREEAAETTVALFVRGTVLMTLGVAWSWVFPINKGLWTSSYVLLTAGQAFAALALCFWFLDAREDPHLRRWSRPLAVYGVNALTVFFLSGIVAKTLILVKVPLRLTHAPDLERTSLQSAIYRTLFEPVPLGPEANSSLLFALVWVAGWYVVLAWMNRRGWVIKV